MYRYSNARRAPSATVIRPSGPGPSAPATRFVVSFSVPPAITMSGAEMPPPFSVATVVPERLTVSVFASIEPAPPKT